MIFFNLVLFVRLLMSFKNKIKVCIIAYKQLTNQANKLADFYSAF